MKKLSLVLMLLVGVSVGCKLPTMLSSSKESGSGSSSSSSKGSGAATASSDPKQDVIETSKKFIALPYFTANMEGQGQTEIKSQVQYASPDKFHVKYLGGTGAGMEMIWMGKDGYMNMNGKWTKMPGATTSIPTLRDSFTEEGLKTLSDVKFDGDDSVDGESALVYSYKNTTPVGNYPFTSKIWVSKDTGLPMKIYVEYTNGQLKNMTINYDTKTPVTIDAPVK